MWQEYQYDVLGRRVRRTVPSVTYASSGCLNGIVGGALGSSAVQRVAAVIPYPEPENGAGPRRERQPVARPRVGLGPVVELLNGRDPHV